MRSLVPDRKIFNVTGASWIKGTTLKRIVILIVLLTLVVGAQPDQSIVGNWVQSSQNAKWSFRDDGTGFMEQGQPSVIARFNWRFQGATLQLSTAGTSIPYDVIQNDGSTLVIKNRRGGQVYELRRDT